MISSLHHLPLILSVLFALAVFARSNNPQVPFINPLIPDSPLGDVEVPQEGLQFSLKHVFHHGTNKYPKLHRRLDIPRDAPVFVTSDDGKTKQPVPRLTAATKPVKIQRLVDRRPETVERHIATSKRLGFVNVLSQNDWTVDDVTTPNVTNKATVLSLAKMAANAYVTEPDIGNWLDLAPSYNYSSSFGWETDGLRGHVYTDQDEKTLVISLKGTTTALFDGEGTTTRDKVNDNLLFSCCCGSGGQYMWRQVCGCYTNTYTCNSTCLKGALFGESQYYRAAMDLYANITAIYPEARNVWLVGHSLGGAVSSLLGQTYGIPVVTFEAVPEALPASRLGLPRPPGQDPSRPQTQELTAVYHFGHTADPVYMGTCNGMTSVCTLAGYAMESTCHTGYRCSYDTVGDLGWRTGIGTHRILSVIFDVIKRYDTVPECVRDTECVDCFNWKFFEGDAPQPTITTTSSQERPTPTKTRTSTCRTPGWWGCLDPTTTVTESLPTTTTTVAPTTTCHTPGWFGCKDPTTTISTSVPSATPTTTTCHTPGWFGCRDPTTTISESVPSTTPVTTPSTTCHTPGWFGCRDPTSTPYSSQTTTCFTPGWFGCRDKPSSTPTQGSSVSPIVSSTSICETPGWFYGCRDKPHKRHGVAPAAGMAVTLASPSPPMTSAYHRHL